MKPQEQLTSERWQEIKAIVAEALEKPTVSRSEFVRERCGGDAELLGEVESLLEQTTGSLETFAQSTTDSLRRQMSILASGQRVGAYRVLREIGRGGMGAVYLAERADGAFEKQVAIKVLKRGTDTDEVLRRFSGERQILARLSHRNIAGLLDAGTTDDGLPYFVMDCVEGKPITKFAEEHKLSIKDRLELFRVVCSAVSYAHQHLIVHRDLKPSNVLVTADGEIKLLDFGIAKLLDEASPEVTMTLQRRMTPEYASPEQVRGADITTVSDVYSLGVLLYELLTGGRPYKLKTRSADEITKAIREQEPDKPSTAVAKQVDNPQSAIRNPKSLRGDLDNIVLKALRKEPERRYASVDQFSADVRRYLEGLPVRARKDTAGYRAGKFIKRHKFGVAAFALMMSILAGGIIATTIEAQRANRRFNEVRQLAHSVLFDYHDAIASLPGSTAVRQRLVNDAQKYLNNLSAEAGNDRALMREIADAYERIAAVQGGVALSPRTGTFLTSSNLGDAPGALENLHKASSLRERLVRAEPSDDQVRLELAFNYTVIGFIHVLNGPPDKAVEYLRKAVPMMESLLAAKPNDQYLQYTLWNAELGLAKSLGNPAVPNLGDWNGAMELMQKCQPLIERLATEHPNDLNYQASIGAQYNAYGQMFAGAGDDQRALDSFKKALQIDQTLAGQDSVNAFYRHELAVQYGNVGAELLKLKDANGALENFKQAVAIYEAMIAADPNDLAGLRNAGVGYRNVATALQASDETAAMKNFEKALKIFGQLLNKDPNNADFRRQQAYTYLLISRMHGEHDELDSAVSDSAEGTKIAEALVKNSPTNASAQNTLAQLYAGAGAIHAALAAKQPDEKQKKEWQIAKEAFRKSLAIYQDLKSKGKLSGSDINKPEEISGEIAKCDAALNR